MPDLGVVEFPDEMTPERMAAHIVKTVQNRPRPTQRPAGMLSSAMPQSPTETPQQKGERYVNNLTKAFQQALTQAIGPNILSGDLPNPYSEDPAEKARAYSALSQAAMNAFGMTVFHGSPHVFDKFDASKIGTGEGAQAYGHGLYFAENPTVAGEYQRKLGAIDVTLDNQPLKVNTRLNTPEALAFEAIQRYHNVKDAARYVRQWGHPEASNAANWLERNSQRLSVQPSGGFYSADLPDEHIAKMLDWDKPLSEQHQEVRTKLQPVIENLRWRARSSSPEWGDLADENKVEALTTGRDLYRMLPLDSATPHTPEGASAYLKSLGIPGIKYLDQGSRVTSAGELLGISKTADGYVAKIGVKNRTGVGFNVPADMITTSKPYATEAEASAWAESKINQGTHNFVVFDPAILGDVKRQ